MSKSTPGPWVAKPRTSGSLTYWVIEEAVYNGFEIARTQNAEVQQDKENAQLIACAPQLIEELKALVQAACSAGLNTVDAEAVIARAEGKKEA